MAITSDQEARVAAAWTDFEVRFFVGADRLLGDIELTAGAAYDPEASTALTADVLPDEEDTITVTSTTGFNTGFVVIHPNAAGEHYELIGYSGMTSNTFTGLTRYETETTDELLHTSGATVSEWMEVTEYIYGNVNLDLFVDNEIGSWEAKIAGHSYKGSVFQPDRAFLCMWRFRPGAGGSMSSWTSWTVAFLGFLENVTVKGDWEEGNDWDANVVSLGHYLDKTDVGSGVTYGKVDLAEDKTVTTSSVLVDVYQEAASGEFVGTPDLSGTQAVDADMSTLWVSDGEPQASEETPVQSAGNVNEVYLRAPSWMPDNLQWFEIYRYGDSWGGQICSSTTLWKWSPWGGPETLTPAREPYNNYLRAAAGSGFAVYTNDRSKFLAHFPTCDADVYDWRSRQVGTFTMNPLGDFLCLVRSMINSEDIVWWDGGRASWSLYDYTGGNGTTYWDWKIGGTNYSGWTGSMIPTPPIGHTFRSNPTGNHGSPRLGTCNASIYKLDEDHPTPGYYLTGEREWLIVDLGALGIALAADLSQGVTTEAYLTGHLGLTSSGYISIDTGGASNEIIGYTSIDRINNKVLGLSRGQAGTSDQAHSSGETVQQYEGGAAVDVPLIQTVHWKRRPVLVSGSTWKPNTLLHFDVYSTIYESGYPTPTDDEWDDGLGYGGWEDWWRRLAGVRWYAQTKWQKTLSSPVRARKVMISIMKMTDAGRAKLNEFSVFGPSGTVLTAGVEDDSWDGSYSSLIITHLLETWFGMDEADVTIVSEGRQVYKLDVTRDRIGQALRDICKSAGTLVYFRLDNTVEVDWNTQLGAGGWPDVTVYWDRDNARDITLSRQTRTNVAQVIVKLTNLEDEETFQAQFPANALPLGDIIEETDTLLVADGDDANDIAQMLFKARSLTDTVTIVAKGIAEWALPGQRHVVTYIVDSDNTFLNGNNVVVTNVNHSIALGDADGKGKAWTTRIQGKRVEYG